MNFHDAQMSDITVVLDKRWESDLEGAVKMLKDAGVEVRNADDDNSVVEGSVETYKLHALEKLDCVDYVRKVMSYDVNFPPGDPRDRDNE